MGIVEWEYNRLKQKEIEVKALVALLRHSKLYRNEAEQALRYVAFPDQLAKKIEQTRLHELAANI